MEPFTAGICATGQTFALASPDGELVVYRAKDLKRAAAIGHPGPGVPAFSRSGRLLVLRDRGGSLQRVYDLR